MTVEQSSPRFHYPAADRDNVSEMLHGRLFTDPYRYLEDPNGERTVAFVEAQNAVSSPINFMPNAYMVLMR